MATVTDPEIAVEVQPIAVEDRLYEVIDGKIVEKAERWGPTKPSSPRSWPPISTLMRGGTDLGRFIVEIHCFGSTIKTQYRPDIAFVSFAEMAEEAPDPGQRALGNHPDLAIEVVSKNDKSVELLAKVRHYFEAGVRGVWLVYPDPGTVPHLRFLRSPDPRADSRWRPGRREFHPRLAASTRRRSSRSSTRTRRPPTPLTNRPAPGRSAKVRRQCTRRRRSAGEGCSPTLAIARLICSSER